MTGGDANERTETTGSGSETSARDDMPSSADANGSWGHEQGDIDVETARRIGENESRFRSANEKIETAALRIEADAPTVPFVCECGRRECYVTLRLALDEYEQAREHPRRFVCCPGHEIIGSGLGRVVLVTDRYVIMEKLGVAGDVAEALDPRTG